MNFSEMRFKKYKKIILLWSIALFSVLAYSFKDDFFSITKQLDIFSTLFKDLNLYYVDEVKPGDLMKTGIDAMLKSLDPYTDYIPESDIEDYRFMTTGQYGGMGATIRKSGEYVVVAEPYEGFPAFKNDLRAGDKIIEIDGKSIKGKNTDDVSKLLKGQPGTEVNLLIERINTSEPILKTLKREEIKINAVPFYGMMENNIGYIQLNQFTESASREVKAAFDDLSKQGELNGLVFDLRGNPGGLLYEAVNISNFFIDKGEDVVFTRGRVKDWDKTYKALNAPIAKDIPLVLMVNSGSASASEIVSGTMQDLDRGVILGQRTYGKGLVQNTRSISYNSKLKLTTAKYYIPSGRCIQAINYSSRNEDGSVARIPDSLAKCFKTRKGRLVKDGGGIEPDVKTTAKKYAKITQSISAKNLIFDYATLFRIHHPTIEEASKFRLTDDNFKEFVDYVKDKDYQYTTKTENLLKEFKEIAEQEKYFEEAKSGYDLLSEKIAHYKKEDLFKYKEEICFLLEEEIVSRYYFQKGRIKNTLSKDKDLTMAIQLITDKEKYAKALGVTGYDAEPVIEKK
jgi:carboxyl-terminal processing protease